MLRARKGALWGILAVAGGVAALASDAATPPRLHEQLADARLVVAGRVSSLESLESGRLLVARLITSDVIKGTPPPGGTVSVVEMREFPSVPALLAENQYVVAFLRPTRMTSMLRQALPQGTYFEPVGGRAGWLASDDAAAQTEVARLVGEMAEASRAPEPDAEKRRTAERARVFARIAARHPALVEDGAAGLSQVRDLSTTLAPEEKSALDAAVAREDLPPRVRARLIEAIAGANLTQMAGTLDALRSNQAEVEDATWKARAKLGQAPAAGELAGQLAASDPQMRIAAVRALGKVESEDERSEAEQKISGVAQKDSDPQVRIAAVETLAALQTPTAISAVERSFIEDPSLETRQAAARALFNMRPKSAAASSLERLVFASSGEKARWAVSLLVLLDAPEAKAPLERIGQTHPEPEVRKVVKEGVPWHAEH